MFGFLKMLAIGAILSIASTISAQALTSKCTNPIECRCDRIDPLKLTKTDWVFWHDNCVTVLAGGGDRDFSKPPAEDPKTCGYEKKKHKKYGKHHGKKYGKHHGGKKKYGKRGGHKKHGYDKRKGGKKNGYDKRKGGKKNGYDKRKRGKGGDWKKDDNDNEQRRRRGPN